MAKKCKYYKPYMDTLKLLIKEFYTLPNCGAGGPLHILLDDDNYDIDSINFCIKYCMDDLRSETPHNPKYVNVLGIMICNEYAKMTLEERAMFDSYLGGRSLYCHGNCKICAFLDDFYEDMKEKEKDYYDNN